MTTITNTFQILIKAQPDVVFAYVADLTKHGEWNNGLLIEVLTTGPVRVGSHYRSRGVVLNQKDRPNELRVTRHDPNTHFAFAAQDPDFKEVMHEFTFSAQAGGTLVERRITTNLPALAAIAFRTFIFPLIGKPSAEKSHLALKTKLEQPAA